MLGCGEYVLLLVQDTMEKHCHKDKAEMTCDVALEQPAVGHPIWISV
jgi:hypothetical protein